MALRKGIDIPDSDQAVAELIFHHDFSTAEKVDDISGRGVGLDAVRSMLQEIEGHIGIGLVGEKHGQYIRFCFLITTPRKSRSKVQKAS